MPIEQRKIPREEIEWSFPLIESFMREAYRLHTVDIASSILINAASSYIATAIENVARAEDADADMVALDVLNIVRSCVMDAISGNSTSMHREEMRDV